TAPARRPRVTPRASRRAQRGSAPPRGRRLAGAWRRSGRRLLVRSLAETRGDAQGVLPQEKRRKEPTSLSMPLVPLLLWTPDETPPHAVARAPCARDRPHGGLRRRGHDRLWHLPIEAFPELADPQVQVITLFPGHAAEEVERQVTLAIEREMN